MAVVPAAGEATLGTWTVVNALGCMCCLGMLWIYRNTIGAAFEGLASYSVGVKWGPRIHPLAPLGKINDAIESNLSSWAEAQQKQMGLAWHYMGSLYDELSKENSNLSSNVLALGHWIVHDYVPKTIKRDTSFLRNRSNKAAAAAALAGVEIAHLKKQHSAQEHTQSQTAAKVQTHVAHAEQTATQAKTIAHSAAHTGAHTAVITVAHPSVAHLPVPFGRTITQIKKRLGRAEAWTAAGALSIAMANVLGIPNPRCLRDGPVGKVARRLCGIPSHFLNDLLGLVADFFILENVCVMLPWLETAASEVGTPLVEVLTVVGSGLCQGSSAPRALQGPKASVPALLFGVSASEV